MRPRRVDVPAATRRTRWERPALALLLVGTAVLCLWDLGASGDANSFYAAAVQAGTQSWKALLFGSLDSGNAITVDKPPAALWVMGLSGRLFGFSSWSMLVPQALEGVGAVALLYAAVRRWSGAGAGLLAGACLALTPVAALMFRFDNPDALLVLLLVAGAYCVVRATERASATWLMLAGAAIGFGFLTKMMQAFLVLPAFALVHLVAAPTSLRRRLVHLLGAGAALVVSAGWYVALVELWPASSRPYIGGSTDNSLLQLALGYNGLSRIFGQGGSGGGPSGRGGPGGGNGGFGGATGLTRLFGQSMGTEISWLLPAALVALVALLWLTRRAPRTDRLRAAAILWGGWLLVTGLVFSYMSGIIHPYYTVALAPAIAALVAIGARELWRRRDAAAARGTLAVMVAGTGVWAYVLLGRDASWLPALRWIAVFAGIAAAAGLLVGSTHAKRTVLAVAVAAIVSGLLGTGAYATATAATPHTGTIPTSGPSSAQQGMAGGPGLARGLPGNAGNQRMQVRTPGDASSSDVELAALLKATHTRWAAATTGSQRAASLELGSGASVLAIGGFSGGDPSPTLAEFQAYVASGQVCYYVASGQDGGMGGPGGGTGDAAKIASWVQAHYRSTTVGGTTVYDLTQPKS